MRTNSFSSALMFIGFVGAMVLPAMALENFYKAEFKEWRDESNSPGFHALLEGKKSEATISVPVEFEFGKVMTPEKSLDMEVSSTLTLQIQINDITDDSSMEIEIMESAPPYSGFKIIKDMKTPGMYSVNIRQATGWEGMRSFWVAVWLHGTGAEAKVSNLQIGEGLKVVNEAAAGDKKRRPRATAKIFGKDLKESKEEFRPEKEKDYAYIENWAQGLNGWRDDSIEKGLNTIAEIQKKGKILLRVKPKTSYGTFVSPPKPFTVDFSKYGILEIETGQVFEGGQVRIRLINSRNPDDFRVVTPNFDRPDVYMINIPDQTGWREERSFYLEILLEGEDAELALNSIGFAKKMATTQGVVVPLQSAVRPLYSAPMKKTDVYAISGNADQAFRTQYMDGAAVDSGNWRLLNRWGLPYRDIGFSEIKQTVYFTTYIHPEENTELWASIGYDVKNQVNNVNWEQPGGRYMQARIDFGTLRYQDLYIGNVSQIGTIYDPMFTDLTFKKASTFRGLLWKPKIGDWQFKLFGTRLSTSNTDYNRNNVYMTAARAMKGFVLEGLGSLQVGLSAVNMSKTNGNMDDNLFIGPDEKKEVYETFLPSVYVRIENNTSRTDALFSHLYFKAPIPPTTYTLPNRLRITNSKGYDINADFTPTASGDVPYYYASNGTYKDGTSGAYGINEGGYLVLRVPLLLNQGVDTGKRISPSDIEGIVMDLNINSWEIPQQGTVEVKISSDGEKWQTLYSFGTSSFTSNNPLMYGSLAASNSFLDEFRQNTFKDETAMARSILSGDIKGQLLGVNIKGEYATSIAHNQTYTGDRVNRFEPAAFLSLSQGFGGALVKANYFYVAPEYSTSFGGFDAVDDNDNKATLPDSDGEKSGVIFGDYYNLGQPSNEYINGLYIPQDYLFHEREDANHNGVLDSRENDHLADYPCRPDQRGADFSAVIPRQVLTGLYMSDVEIGLYAQRMERLTRKGRNEYAAINMNYRNTDIDDVDASIGVYGARIRDDISDQYELYNAKDEDEVKDRIYTFNEYEDNLVLTPEVKLQYKPTWGLRATVLDRYRYNKQLFGDKREFHGNFCSVDVRYKHYLVESLAVKPVYIGRFGARQANIFSPIHNTYYIPLELEYINTGDMPIFHGFYLQNSLTIINEYQLAIDLGRELTYMALNGQADSIHDTLVLGLLRDLPRGYVRVRYEMNKTYYPYANANNWGQNAVWAQLTLTF